MHLCLSVLFLCENLTVSSINFKEILVGIVCVFYPHNCLFYIFFIYQEVNSLSQFVLS